MNTVIIFAAKYLIALPVAGALGYALVMRRKRAFLTFAALVLVLSYLFGLLAGALYYNPRPFVADGVTPLFAHAANNGFPSDHTLLSAALAASVTPFNLALGVVLWVVAFAIGAARVLALVHHPIDIAGSFVIVIIAMSIAAPLTKLIRARMPGKDGPLLP